MVKGGELTHKYEHQPLGWDTLITHYYTD